MPKFFFILTLLLSCNVQLLVSGDHTPHDQEKIESTFSLNKLQKGSEQYNSIRASIVNSDLVKRSPRTYSHMDEILPGLYLGSQEAADRYYSLFSHILSCRDDAHKPKSKQIVWKEIPIDDTVEAQILPYFDDTYQFIESTSESILVHCKVGVSRSSTVVVAYLMKKFEVPFDAALKFVQKKHPSANPNPGFQEQLKQYEKILKENSEQKDSAIISERDDMFMLATLGFAYGNIKSYPKVGYNIASLIAWNVEDTSHTPEFVIEQNRNFEMQGDIFHAEVNTLRKAFLKKSNFNMAVSTRPIDRYRDYTYRLAQTTLYTSLEPCPMCAMTLLLARVPRVIYFMEDTGLHDPETHTPTLNLPNEAYRRKISISFSSLALAQTVQRAMREEVSRNSEKSYIERLPDGRKTINIINYITTNGEEIFGEAHKQLFCYVAQHEENKQLLERLKETIGTRE